MNLVGLFFVAAGLFSIAGAWFDWDWFMNARKARFMVRTFGRKGARIFYGCLGLGLLIFGILGTFGMIDFSN